MKRIEKTIYEEEFKEYITKKQNALVTFKGRSRIDILRVSALTGHGVSDSFKMFVKKSANTKKCKRRI